MPLEIEQVTILLVILFYQIRILPCQDADHPTIQSRDPNDRPRLYSSSVNDAVAARIVSQRAVIYSCPRWMILAGLRCPCANPGGRCADPYSVCSLENKCVCNPQFGSPDSRWKKCIRYDSSSTNVTAASTAYTTRTSTPTSSLITTPTIAPTTNTALTSTTTLAAPTTTTHTTAATSAKSTAPTTASTSTTTTTTTGASTTKSTTTATEPTTPAQLPKTHTYVVCHDSGPDNPKIRTLNLPDWFDIVSDNYPSSTLLKPISGCSYRFTPPPGKRVNVQCVEMDTYTNGICYAAVWVSDIMPPSDFHYCSTNENGPCYCNALPPPPNKTFDSDQDAIIAVSVSNWLATPYKFKLRITAV